MNDIAPRVRALENDTHTIKIDQARLGERVGANKDDIAELKDGMKVIGEVQEAIGGLKRQSTITWTILLLQTGSMMALAWALLQKATELILEVASVVP